MWTTLRSYATLGTSNRAGLGRWAMADAVENHRARVLVVDDETAGQLAVKLLSQAGYECDYCPTGETALTTLAHSNADVVVSGVQIPGHNGTPGIDGTELLSRLQARRPDIPVIMIGDPSVSAAVAAIRHGAFDYVTKPIVGDELTATVTRAIEMARLRHENRRLKTRLEVSNAAAGFIAESDHSKQLVAMIRRVAPSRSTALIEGESGTGKELVARMLHYWSRRADGPFIAINCKAFADGVVESELFGHEKGSFTGAIAARAGCFERASGGTLFLDEIAEAGPDFQAKLLRVLEDGEVLRVGASKPRKIDVRIVAATNRVLRKEVAEGKFRADLYFRLNVIPIRIAPLRERTEDVLALADYLLTSYSAEAGRTIRLSDKAKDALLAYSWPGNVRELENVIERAVVLSGAEVLTPDALALDPGISEPLSKPPSAPATPDETLQVYLDRATAAKIKAALDAAHGNRAEAAATLGVDRTTLYRLMKRLGL